MTEIDIRMIRNIISFKLIESLFIISIVVIGCGNSKKSGDDIASPTNSDISICGWSFAEGDKDKDKMYDRWKNEVENAKSNEIESILLKIASEVNDENDTGAFFHVIAFYLNENILGNTSLAQVLRNLKWRGATYNKLLLIINFDVPINMDIHQLTMNSHVGSYLYKFGTDQNGKPLSSWTIGDTWHLEEVTNDPFPRVKVTIKTGDRLKARNEALQRAFRQKEKEIFGKNKSNKND